MSLKVRIYLDKKLNLGLDLVLEKEDAHYLKNVMRLREGGYVFLFNSKDGEFKGEIISFHKKNTKIKLISKIENINKEGKISLIFSLIKSSKLDYLIQKCTEVGVKNFFPIISEKSIAKDLNIERIEKIIKESCEQSNQLYLPVIHTVEKLEKKLKSLNKNSINQIDLAAEDLRLAVRSLGEIVGYVNFEELLDRIFKDFCIGK